MRTLTVLAISALAALGLAGPVSAASYDTHLTRAPYLTDLVGLHVIVNFATDQSGTTASVSYGPFDGTTCTLPSTQSATRSTVKVGTVSEYQWKASLTLPSAGQYCYRVMLGGVDLLGAGDSPVFMTQAPAGSSQPFSFAVFGDWGLVDANGNNQDQQNLLGTLAGSGVRFAVTTGDNGYPSGSQTNYGDLKQVGAAMGAIFGARFWPVPGRLRAALHGIRQPRAQRHHARRPHQLAAGCRRLELGRPLRERPLLLRQRHDRDELRRAPGTPSTPGRRDSMYSRRPGGTPIRARRASMRTTTRPTSRRARPSTRGCSPTSSPIRPGSSSRSRTTRSTRTTRARGLTRSSTARTRSRACSRPTA